MRRCIPEARRDHAGSGDRNDRQNNDELPHRPGHSASTFQCASIITESSEGQDISLTPPDAQPDQSKNTRHSSRR